jgi:hypothetical protein
VRFMAGHGRNLFGPTVSKTYMLTFNIHESKSNGGSRWKGLQRGPSNISVLGCTGNFPVATANLARGGERTKCEWE